MVEIETFCTSCHAAKHAHERAEQIKNGIPVKEYTLLEDQDGIEKPCYMLDYCPYGELVEQFPFHPIATEHAVKNHMWWSHQKNGKCNKNTADAILDVNGASELVDEPRSCSVFGHDCPAFYTTEFITEAVFESSVMEGVDDGEPVYECRCVCGNAIFVKQSDLESGKVTSCGHCS
jgi:hypothetical protein